MESFVMSSPAGNLKLKSRLRMAASNMLKKAGNRGANRNGVICNTIGGKAQQRRANGHFLRRYSHPSTHQHQLQHQQQAGKSGVNTNSSANLEGAKAEEGSDGSQSGPLVTNGLCKGPFTRAVYNAICGRLGETLNIPEEAVLPLFQEMQLYPSKEQVADMLHCARQCGRRHGGPLHLTFAEFCLFAREMQTTANRISARTANVRQSKRCTNNCEVFLGGSCNPTTWRVDTAIPELQKHGITYYNPQVPTWAPELVAAEHAAKESASVLLYVVDSQTRSVSGMIEVAFLVASGRCVVLVAYPYRFGQSIMGEVITHSECRDLVAGQTTLLALVKSRGIRVHANLASAIRCTTRLLRNPCVGAEMTAEEQITYKLRMLRRIFDLYDGQRRGEISLADAVAAYGRATGRALDAAAARHYLNPDADACAAAAEDPLTAPRFTFQHFCALVAEFGADGCERHASANGWISQPLQCLRYQAASDAVDPFASHRNTNSTDIFLGGSCRTRPCKWRQKAAWLIRARRLTYYDPTEPSEDSSGSEEPASIGGDGGDSRVPGDSRTLNESTVLRWRKAIDRSRVLLFVVAADTRSLTTMIMAAYYIGLSRDVVLCVQHLSEEDGTVGNEKLSKQAIKDYNRGRVYLTDLAKRRHVAVFENITKAVQCAIEKCQR